MIDLHMHTHHSDGTNTTEEILKLAQKEKMEFYCPPLVYCTDNAAMIGAAAYFQYLKNNNTSIE